MRFSFLICTERSGSNLITSLLNGHSKICGPPPTHLFRLFCTNYQAYGDLESEESWGTLISDLVDNFECGLGLWNTRVTRDELAQAPIERSVIALLRYLYEKEALNDGARVVFVKENHTYRFAKFLADNIPGCRFLWMVRDPRDVASSWLLSEIMPEGVERATKVWLEDQTRGKEFFGKLSPKEGLFMRYEDLLSDPVAALKDVSRFLGLKYEPDMLNAHRDNRTASNASRIKAWKNLSKPLIRNNASKHLKHLTTEDIRFIETRCSALMREFGYEVGQHDLTAVDLDELRGGLSTKLQSEPEKEELEIRKKRLQAMQRVFSRSFK